MEDWNMIAADCVVISCCCQCLILRILVFLLLELPFKLVRKTKQYIVRKLGNNARRMRRGKNVLQTKMRRYVERHGSRVLRNAPDPDDQAFPWSDCLEEVERVFDEMYMKGEFGFGSFWCGYGDVEETDNLHYMFCRKNFTPTSYNPLDR